MTDWLPLLVPTVASGIFGGAVATWLRTRPAMAKVELEGAAALWAELRTLREELGRERELCDERIGRIEARNERDRGEMKGALRVLRHERNNISQGFNALLTMIKRLDNPQLSGIAATVEEMVAKGAEQIAVEKAALSNKGIGK
jgi:hypothetical protein